MVFYFIGKYTHNETNFRRYVGKYFFSLIHILLLALQCAWVKSYSQLKQIHIVYLCWFPII